MNLKLSLKHYVVEFKKIIQKLVYCIWNKFCSEELSRKEEFYILKDIKFELTKEGVAYLSERNEVKNAMK